jgi:signal transduction histidine kinase
MPVLLPPVAGTLVILIAVLTLIGWQFRIRWLREPFGGPTAPNTALGAILLSIALILHRWKEHRWAHYVGFLFAAVAGSFAIVTFVEQVTSIDTGLSQLFFHHRLSDWELPTPPGRFSPNSAICIILLALSLIASYEEIRKSLVEFLAALGLFIAGLAAIGHIYGVPSLYSFEVQNSMAFMTSIFMLLIGVGILFAVAHGGWMGVVLRNDAAGLLSRRIFLFSFLVVPFIGWIAVSIERRQLISAAFGTSILVVTVLLIIATTVFRSAREIRRLERERRNAEDQLRQAEKLAVTGRLAATLAHEVNNPLEAVTNILYLLDHDPGLATQSKQFLSMAQEELSRVSHITRQTLGFYREPVAPAVIRPAELVRQTVAVFEPKLLSKNLRVSVCDFMQGAVTFFPGELKQMVTNLLSNAMDASEPGGMIVIRVRATMPWNGRSIRGFRITVSDNGSGIHVEHRPQLFQPFFTTKGQKGTGLGLWVTQGLIQKHGGQLRMRTSTKPPRRGTTFSFFLPAEVHGANETQVTTAS